MAESPSVKIRVRSGDSEAEIEAALADFRQAIELIPDVLAKLPHPPRLEPTQGPAPTMMRTELATASSPETATLIATGSTSPSSTTTTPVVTIEKGDSLSDVISKFFSDRWGRNPRKLMEVREALQSYGLNYPKQSVAVALLRLAKASKIRRFKGESGEYVYTASTGALRIAPPLQPMSQAHPAEVESAPVLEGQEGQQPQQQQQQQDELDLNPPSAN